MIDWYKAVTWRLWGLCLLAVMAHTMTGSWPESSALAIVYGMVQIPAYVIHERAWQGTRIKERNG